MRAEWRRLAGALIWVAVATAGCADLRELTASPEELRRQQEERSAAERQGQLAQARATLGRSPDPRERAEAAGLVPCTTCRPDLRPLVPRALP